LGAEAMEEANDATVERIDCVDLDRDTYCLFHTVFPKVSPKIHCYLTDAETFLRQESEEEQGKYDIIMDDVFTDTKIFLDYALVASCIRPGGYLFINLHNVKDFHSIEQKLKDVFTNVDHYSYGSICVVCHNPKRRK
jgi:spermidine synthase